ncbi:MAG: glycosyltransferase family 2 protein [Vicinamibacterales bacterium]
MMPLSFVGSLTVFFVTLAVGYLVIVAAASLAGALSRGGRRERAVDAYEALAVSRFTIPVSVIVPVGDGDHASLSRSIQSLLDLNYPELEVVVVTERMPDAAVEALKSHWALAPKELFYRRSLATAAVHRIFASERDARLVLVEKAPGGRADALNCGVSFARFRYIVSVSPRVVFDANALLRLMSPALRDPATVLAVTSYVERRREPRAAHAQENVEWTRAGDDYQRLASIRSWMASRLAWHQLRCGLPPRDGVSAFRRDALLEIGGFSVDAADAELDLLIRLQTGPSSGRVVRTSEVFGHLDTLSVPQAAATSGRRRRALLQAFRTFATTYEGGPARVTMMAVLLVELITPAAQVFVMGAIIAATSAGWVNWNAPFLVLLFLTFGYGLISACALLLRGGTPGAPGTADLRRLLMRAPLEFVVYRPVFVWALLTRRPVLR